MPEKFINILREATCYDCRWRLMYEYLASGIDILVQRGAVLKIHDDYEKIKKQAKNNGLPSRAYPAGEAEFFELSDGELRDSLREKIETAIGKMNKPDYKYHCKDKPVQVLTEILAQI